MYFGRFEQGFEQKIKLFKALNSNTALTKLDVSCKHEQRKPNGSRAAARMHAPAKRLARSCPSPAELSPRWGLGGPRPRPLTLALASWHPRPGLQMLCLLS